jgi:hypothetical protein
MIREILNQAVATRDQAHPGDAPAQTSAVEALSHASWIAVPQAEAADRFSAIAEIAARRGVLVVLAADD